MRWFTREYVNGELDDTDQERRQRDYRRHLDALEPQLTDGAELLVRISLHDAQLLDLATDARAGGLTLGLLCGDRQRGYERITLRYQHAELIGADAEAVREWLSTGEIVEDEIDRHSSGFEHRMLVWPDGEFAVRFAAVLVEREPADTSERR
jgi:hypothetical protein